MLQTQSSMRQISYSLRDKTIGVSVWRSSLSWVAVMVFCLLEHAGLLGAQKLRDLFPSITISLKLYTSPAEISLFLSLFVLADSCCSLSYLKVSRCHSNKILWASSNRLVVPLKRLLNLTAIRNISNHEKFLEKTYMEQFCYT